MSLPKISQPTFEETVPSLGQKIKMRRFLVAEEKKLLMAKESDEDMAMPDAIVQVVSDCIIDSIDVYELAPFDLDWLFLRLRAQSVDNIVKIKYTDNADGGEEHNFEFSLDTVEMPVPTEMKKTIQLDDSVSIEVAFPTVAAMQEATNMVVNGQTERSLEDLVIASSIRRVFNKDGEEFTADTEEEIFSYIESFPTGAYKELKKFLDSIPELSYRIPYENTKGEQHEVVLSGLQDFFTF